MLELDKIDYWIVSLLLLLLPVDMINGILLHNNIILPISISQIYKVFILFFFLVRILVYPNKTLIVLVLIATLFFPTLYQIIRQGEASFIVSDTIKLLRYLLPLFSFMFFSALFKKYNPENHQRAFQLIKFSYIVLVINIFIKYLGLGYPMYSNGNIGSRGFFNAGNELSVLLVILCSILAYNLWIQNKTKKYCLFLVLNVFVGISLSSKTGLLGILLVFFLIPLKPISLTINIKRLKITLVSLIIGLPLIVLIAWKIIKNSTIFLRLSFFWDKLDLLTFIFSSRNIFAENALNVYKREYNLAEKIVGVGQTRFEMLNGDKIVEIDFLDIFFAYGFVGVITFILFLIYLIVQAGNFRKNANKYFYARFVFLMTIIIFGISTIAGHVFNSGIAGVFLGLMFSLMYLKANDKEREVIAL